MAKILTQVEIERELMAAELSGKTADFSNKVLQEINLSEMEIKTPVSFQNTKILGRAYFNRTIFNKDLNFNSAIINRIFYLGEATIKGNLNGKEIKVREGLNMVGALLEKDAVLEEAKIRGFLGLNKAEIKGEANFGKIMVLNFEISAGIIAGDIFLQGANFKKNVNLSEAVIAGGLDLRGVKIFGSLDLSQTEIKGNLFLRGGVIGGEINLTGLKYKEKML